MSSLWDAVFIQVLPEGLLFLFFAERQIEDIEAADVLVILLPRLRLRLGLQPPLFCKPMIPEEVLAASGQERCDLLPLRAELCVLRIKQGVFGGRHRGLGQIRVDVIHPSLPTLPHIAARHVGGDHHPALGAEP
jgi:hypothetical protein